MAGVTAFFSMLNCFKSCKSEEAENDAVDREDGVTVQTNLDVNNVTVCCISSSNADKKGETMQSV